MESVKEYDKKIVNKYRGVLRTCHADLTREDLKEIRKAFNLCYESTVYAEPFLGDIFMLYPLSVGRIISSELGLGPKSIISSFLYPCVKHGYLDMEIVKNNFKHPVPAVVESLVRISSYDKLNNVAQADHFRKLILSVSKDLRVILVKLSERLWIMRHLHRFTSHTRLVIAKEVSHIYAPLAHRFGLYIIKTELDDLALRYLEPEPYKMIERKLKDTTSKRNRFIRKFVEPIKSDLNRLGFDYEIKGRTKSVYSIWNKMKKQDVEFDEVYDIFAIRIILNTQLRDEKTDCWAVYSLVSNHYQPNPGRMRDWISIPKSNGYESLHTTVLVPGGKWVEVQIRTKRMDEIAEKGLAAHWRYKEGGEEDMKFEKWIASIRDIIEASNEDTLSLIENVDLQAYEDEVFVFTPKGELKKYPQGAIVLDFAFDIHTDIGATCTGAKVNNINVPIRYELKNGDEVEIITAKSQKPKIEWLDIVKTSRAKSKIKQIVLKDKNKDAEVGKEILARRCKNWKIDLTDTTLHKLLKKFGFENAVDFYLAIANGRLDLSELKKHVRNETEHLPDAQSKPLPNQLVKLKNTEKKDHILIDDLSDRVDYKLAQCCKPVFGDPILGFVSVSEGIKIHRNNCINISQLKEKYPYRIVNVSWTKSEKKTKYPTVISINGYDDMGLVNRISSIISQELKVEMQSISFESKNGIFSGKITILVHDTDYLDVLIEKIRKIKGVLNVSRYEETGV